MKWFLATVAFYGCYVWMALAAAGGFLSLGEMTLYMVAFRQGQLLAQDRGVTDKGQHGAGEIQSPPVRTMREDLRFAARNRFGTRHATGRHSQHGKRQTPGQRDLK